MIFTNQKYLSFYVPLIPQLERVANQIDKLILGFQPNTSEELGDGMRVIYYEGNSLGQPKLEVHREFIDFHLVLDGCDRVGVKFLLDFLSVDTGYIESDDYLLFGDDPDNLVDLKSGEIGIYFPTDAHAPLAGNQYCKKLVIKIPIANGR